MTILLLGPWGLLGAASPVAWGTWVVRTMPKPAAGLPVAVVQLAATPGAVVGGLLSDASGHQATFGVSAMLLLVAALLALLTSRSVQTGSRSASVTS